MVSPVVAIALLVVFVVAGLIFQRKTRPGGSEVQEIRSDEPRRIEKSEIRPPNNNPTLGQMVSILNGLYRDGGIDAVLGSNLVVRKIKILGTLWYLVDGYGYDAKVLSGTIHSGLNLMDIYHVVIPKDLDFLHESVPREPLYLDISADEMKAHQQYFELIEIIEPSQTGKIRFTHYIVLDIKEAK